MTHDLPKHFNWSLTPGTAVFGITIIATFAFRYAIEETSSVHTVRREAFYPLAVLFAFALGIATGDLIADKYGLGHFKAMLLFAGLTAVVAVDHLKLGLNATLSFSIAYILTRPWGTSISDPALPAPHTSQRRQPRRVPRQPRPRDDLDEPDLPRRDPRWRGLHDQPRTILPHPHLRRLAS